MMNLSVETKVAIAVATSFLLLIWARWPKGNRKRNRQRESNIAALASTFSKSADNAGVSIRRMRRRRRLFRLPLTIFLRPKLEVGLSCLHTGFVPWHFAVLGRLYNLRPAVILHGTNWHI